MNTQHLGLASYLNVQPKLLHKQPERSDVSSDNFRWILRETALSEIEFD